MTSLCSLLDDWENCAAPNPSHRQIQVRSATATVAQEPTKNIVTTTIHEPQQTQHPEPKIKQHTVPQQAVHNPTHNSDNSTQGKADQCCEATHHEFEALRKRVDADRQYILALTSALIIILIMQITAQFRIDQMFNRKT